MADSRHDLYPGLGLGSERVVYPLPVLIKHFVDLLAALLEAPAPDGLELFFQAQRELFHLAGLQSFQLIEGSFKPLL